MLMELRNSARFVEDEALLIEHFPDSDGHA